MFFSWNQPCASIVEFDNCYYLPTGQNVQAKSIYGGGFPLKTAAKACFLWSVKGRDRTQPPRTKKNNLSAIKIWNIANLLWSGISLGTLTFSMSKIHIKCVFWGGLSLTLPLQWTFVQLNSMHKDRTGNMHLRVFLQNEISHLKLLDFLNYFLLGRATCSTSEWF